MKNKISPTALFIIISLMITFIVVQLNIFSFFDKPPEVVKENDPQYGIIPPQKAEAQMYLKLHDDSPIPVSTSGWTSAKTEKTFYKNRAYAGAPPRIPHAVDEVLVDGSFESCLQCHRDGSYSIEMKAYAPIAPHPDFTNCRQCHVPQLTKKLFKPTNWENEFKVVKGRRHLPGSPPVIPHSLQLRENCLSCHLGEGSMQEIKVSHPERTNCRQCHVQTSTTNTFEREMK
jgi:cytochrome c-type protein NapB